MNQIAIVGTGFRQKRGVLSDTISTLDATGHTWPKAAVYPATGAMPSGHSRVESDQERRWLKMADGTGLCGGGCAVGA